MIVAGLRIILQMACAGQPASAEGRRRRSLVCLQSFESPFDFAFAVDPDDEQDQQCDSRARAVVGERGDKVDRRLLVAALADKHNDEQDDSLQVHWCCFAH
jgi:hypothetical protein